MINREEALKIAGQNAALYYNDLSVYIVTIQWIGPNWKVDYDLKDTSLDGGGPHYLISGGTGEIIESRFFQ
jgi:hypothetical protein